MTRLPARSLAPLLLCLALPISGAAAQTLSVRGERLAVDETPQFLLFVSYFHGLERPAETLAGDLAWLSSRGVGGVRVWPNATRPRLMDASGRLNPAAVTALTRLIAEAARHRLVVDVTFHREGVCGPPDACGFTVAEYTTAIVAAAKALRGHANVLFDLQNEWNVAGRAGLTFDDLMAIRSAVKGAHSSLVVTASTSGSRHAEAAAQAFDLLAYHDERDGTGKWAAGTAELVASLRRHRETAGKPPVPIYLQEPNRFRVGADPESYYDGNVAHYVTAATEAKRAGAAAWTFHTAASFNLASATAFADLLQPGEREVLEHLARAGL